MCPVFDYRCFLYVYRVVKPDYMLLEIKTEAQNGVILWQGQVSIAKCRFLALSTKLYL